MNFQFMDPRQSAFQSFGKFHMKLYLENKNLASNVLEKIWLGTHFPDVSSLVPPDISN